MRRIAPLLLAVLFACADQGEWAAPDPPLPASDPSLLVGSGMVLQRGDAPPQLCLGGVAESYPPQCSGIPLRGWDWGSVNREERAGDTTWADAKVTGSFEGDHFVVVEVGPSEPWPDEGYDFTVPCPEPEGGWVPGDPASASEADRIETVRVAEDQPDHTGSWIEYLEEPVGEQTGPYVLVLGFTGDLERHRDVATETWGGPLCVFEQARPFSELRSIQRQLEGAVIELGMEQTFSGIDVSANQVELGVVASTPDFEAALTERFGEGAIRVVPALRPVS